MLVLITDSEVRVNEPHELRSLAITTRVPLDSTVAALHSAGLCSEIRDGHAWLSIAALKRIASVPGPEWAGQFDTMIETVRPYGWVSADGLTVRAHVERD